MDTPQEARGSVAPSPADLESLCYERVAKLLPKYQPQQPFNDQLPVYNKDRDDGDETILVVPFTYGPINAGRRCRGGGCPMSLRELVYNDLVARGKTEAVAKEWGAVAAEFEQVCGLKEKYTRADVTAFVGHLRKRGLLQNTIDKDLKAIKLLAEIQRWGEGPQGTDFPKLSLRLVSEDEIRRTILSKNTIGSMITSGKQGLLSDIELCYLALDTTFGLRRVEMVRLKPASFPDERHLIVDTAHGGRRTIHTIPSEIAPYLSSFRHYEADSLTHMFHRIASKLGLDTGAGYGWHSIRRSLATEFILSEASALNVVRFMRWSETSVRREFGMLAIYAKKDQARIDEEIFKIHPFLPYWGTDESRQVERKPPGKLQPLIDLIESGELDEEEIEQLITLARRLKEGKP